MDQSKASHLGPAEDGAVRRGTGRWVDQASHLGPAEDGAVRRGMDQSKASHWGPAEDWAEKRNGAVGRSTIDNLALSPEESTARRKALVTEENPPDTDFPKLFSSSIDEKLLVGCELFDCPRRLQVPVTVSVSGNLT